VNWKLDMESNRLEGLDGIRPVRKTRAYEEIVRQVRTLTERELLKPGDRLPSERELAEQFQVSRVTVRQALSVLQAMGLIDSRVGDGTFAGASANPVVTVLAPMLSPPKSTLLEQLELRRLIEPEVARLAAERATDAQIDEMRRSITLQVQKLVEGVSFVEEDSALHLTIARSSQNSLLVRMIESIHELLRGSREESLRARTTMERSLAGHRRIIDAIARHDPAAARRAMLRHVLDVESMIIALHRRQQKDSTG
jgi:GntR family transcriptional regulator, transcriptional repressor for pyruvate dehydrogenase complex